jgi:hypothetical protein
MNQTEEMQRLKTHTKRVNWTKDDLLYNENFKMFNDLLNTNMYFVYIYILF